MIACTVLARPFLPLLAGLALVASAASPAPASAQLPPGTWGARIGAGTDVTLGVAVGGQVNYRLERGTNHLEVGPMLYYASSEETTVTSRTYIETTDLLVFGVMATWLFGYAPDAAYFTAGVGLTGISVTWEERSPDDSSLGIPFGPSGSFQQDDGVAGGSVVSVGVGRTVGSSGDLRLELPMIIIWGAPGEASSVVPTATITCGFRFR